MKYDEAEKKREHTVTKEELKDAVMCFLKTEAWSLAEIREKLGKEKGIFRSEPRISQIMKGLKDDGLVIGDWTYKTIKGVKERDTYRYFLKNELRNEQK